MSIYDQRPIRSEFTATSTTTDVLSGAELTGSTALVTGASSGLGLETTRALTAAGARVIAPVRRQTVAGTPLVAMSNVDVVPNVDFADLHSVAGAADHIRAIVPQGLDMVIAAAGVMATPHQSVGPGWEYQFTVNHLGHFALITRLYPLVARRGGRIVVYSSAGHHSSDIRWGDPHFLQGYDKWLAYGQSKTANILFTVHLDSLGQQDGVRAFSLHPGKILTGLQRDLQKDEQIELGWINPAGTLIAEDFKTPAQGAATGVWAATSESLEGVGGLYLEDCDIASSVACPGGSIDDGGVQPYALDTESAERLWLTSVAITASDILR